VLASGVLEVGGDNAAIHGAAVVIVAASANDEALSGRRALGNLAWANAVLALPVINALLLDCAAEVSAASNLGWVILDEAIAILVSHAISALGVGILGGILQVLLVLEAASVAVGWVDNALVDVARIGGLLRLASRGADALALSADIAGAWVLVIADAVGCALALGSTANVEVAALSWGALINCAGIVIIASLLIALAIGASVDELANLAVQVALANNALVLALAVLVGLALVSRRFGRRRLGGGGGGGSNALVNLGVEARSGLAQANSLLAVLGLAVAGSLALLLALSIVGLEGVHALAILSADALVARAWRLGTAVVVALAACLDRWALIAHAVLALVVGQADSLHASVGSVGRAVAWLLTLLGAAGEKNALAEGNLNALEGVSSLANSGRVGSRLAPHTAWQRERRTHWRKAT